MDEKYEYVKQQEQRTRRRNRITRSTGLQDKRERDTEIGWLSEGAREREMNTIRYCDSVHGSVSKCM